MSSKLSKLWEFLVNSKPGRYDLRLVVPSHAQGNWPDGKRLFVLKGEKHNRTLHPLLGDGSSFEVSEEYLARRTVILPAGGIPEGRAAELEFVMAKSDFLWYKAQVLKRKKHVNAEHTVPYTRDNSQALNMSKWREANPTAKSFFETDGAVYYTSARELEGSSADLDQRHKEFQRLLDQNIAEMERTEKQRIKAVEAEMQSEERRSTQFNRVEKESKMKQAINDSKEDVVASVKVAAQVTAGRTMNGLVADKLTPYVPKQYAMLLDSPIGAVVIANLVNTLANVYLESNGSDVSYKLSKLGSTMVTAATVDFVDAFDIDQIVREFLSSSEAKAVLDKV